MKLKLEEVFLPVKELMEEMCLGAVTFGVKQSTIGGLCSVRASASFQDAGILIGKLGVRSRAMATIVEMVGAAHGLKAELRDYGRLSGGVQNTWAPDGVWPASRIEDVLSRLMAVILPGVVVEQHEIGDSVEVTLWATQSDPQRVVAMVTSALGVIMTAIGRKHGKAVSVTAELAEGSHQPKSADGRFSKEVKL